MLKKTYVRDGNNRIIGSITGGFSEESEIVRDEDGNILGRTSERFGTTRDASGKIISNNAASTGLLFGRKE